MGLDRRQFDNLMTVDLTDGLDPFRLLRQLVATMLALRWQDRDKVIYSLRLHQRAMAPIVACLTARLTFALLPFLSLPLVPSHAVGGGGLGRVGGVLLAGSQLTLQIGDLLVLFRDGLVFVRKVLVFVPDLFLSFL